MKPELAIYAVSLMTILFAYGGLRLRNERRSGAILEAAQASGMTEPASLHPVIDPNHCVGCAACANACPEKDVLGIIGGKANLISPTSCIGHGACKQACPADAISLVFGTERRGVDIPLVDPDFQTNVPGIFIAGELGGMGLIRNAIEQGRQAVESVCQFCKGQSDDLLDLVIVGAGPAGFAASLAAMERNLRYVTLEQDSLGGTVSHYPRGKIVMTTPVKLPIYGKAKFTETTKETLLAFWEDVQAHTSVKINFNERVERIARTPDSFEVDTARQRYRARAVLLAIGRRGTPRTLDVPGEDLPKVVYRLIDPSQYAGRHVLVVGGGDSALEAAWTLAGEPGTVVTLSYRGDAFSRAKEKNRQRVQSAEAEGRLEVLLQSNPVRITGETVEIEGGGQVRTLENDAVIICAGGILPTAFLKSIGITVETKYGTA